MSEPTEERKAAMIMAAQSCFNVPWGKVSRAFQVTYEEAWFAALDFAEAARGSAAPDNEEAMERVLSAMDEHGLIADPEAVEFNEKVARMVIAAVVSPNGNEADEGERCSECGRRATWGLGAPDHTYWFAPNELWNEVVAERSLILCALCFETACSERGIGIGWCADRIGEIERHAEGASPNVRERELEDALRELGRAFASLHFQGLNGVVCCPDAEPGRLGCKSCLDAWKRGIAVLDKYDKNWGNLYRAGGSFQPALSASPHGEGTPNSSKSIQPLGGDTP